MKCKRCGTLINVYDHLCKGCGKSIIALRADNEIIYDGSDELSQLQIEKNKTEEEKTTKKIKPEVEIDIFNDALYKSNIKEQNINNSVQNHNTNNVSSIIENSTPPLEDFETINSSKLSEIDKIEIIDIEDSVVVKPTKIKEKKIEKLPIILSIIAIVFVIIALCIYIFVYKK